MKQIQWYPGHMAKAMRLMEENLKLCDALVFVLDARAPASSYNPKLQDLAGGKPVLFLFNKSDLADKKAEDLAEAMRQSGRKAFRFSAIEVSARKLQSYLGDLVREKAEKLKEKGSKKPLRFLIAGVPNTGKSTLINLLSGSKKAQVGDKAGVTKTKQWVRCGEFELMDTPGTMPPAFSDRTLAQRVAYLGCINDEILPLDEIALSLLKELSEKYPAGIYSRYGIQPGEPLKMLEGVCKARGFLSKGNEYDYDRAERALLDDFRKGRLGKTTLDEKEDLVRAGLL